MAEPLPIISRADQAAHPRRAPRKPGIRLALLAAILLWLSAPPARAWPLAWVALAPLLVCVAGSRHAGQAAWRGYLFGWVYLGAVWYWIGTTVVGWTGSAIGWLAWYGLTLALALFYAAWAGAAWWILRRGAGGWRVVGVAAAWVVMEWARTLGPLSMPWAQLSYTQYRFLPILQIADFTGAYGVSFVIVLSNAALALWWIERRAAIRYVWTAATLVVMVSLYGVARLAQPETGVRIEAAALQTGVNPFETPTIDSQAAILSSLTRQTEERKPSPVLDVWPESAAPGDALHDFRQYDMFRRLAEQSGAAVVAGTQIEDVRSSAVTNSALLFPPSGKPPERYDKRQLVPFGEFIPFRNLVVPLFGQAFGLRQGDVTPGQGSQLLRFQAGRSGPVRLGVYICYESMYPGYARTLAGDGANLLATITNDAWFRSRAAEEQHLSAAVLRGVENRRDTVRSGDTGISCLIDAEGRILARAPGSGPAFAMGPLHLQAGRTLYTRLGDWLVLVSALLAAGVISRLLPFRRALHSTT